MTSYTSPLLPPPPSDPLTHLGISQYPLILSLSAESVEFVEKFSLLLLEIPCEFYLTLETNIII